MKFLILQLVAIFGLAGVLLAEDLTDMSLTPNEQAEVKQKLAAFDKGQITLTNLTDSQEWSLKLIKYYLSHTNVVTTKMKLPISRSFAAWSKYPDAAKLAEEYVGVYSNDWRGWTVLGLSEFVMQRYDEAIAALTNAVTLGDEKNYAALGGAALAINRLDLFERMVTPHLLISINDVDRFPKEERLKMRCLLIVYALKADKQDIFVKATEGLETEDITSNDTLKNQMAYGCEIFKGKDIDKICQKLGVTPENNSKTNTVSNP